MEIPVNVEINPKWFTKKIVLWYRLVHWCCARWAKKIFTVSDFSKQELVKVYNIPEQKIINIGDGWRHIKHVQSDNDVVEKFGLIKKNFYYSLGTKPPHTNMNLVFDNAQNHPEKTFAISGSANNKIFGRVLNQLPSNVRFLGYLSDPEIKALMENCEAFIFPSFYEGFGIPPLEALSLGCPVVVSNISVMREIFDESVHYIDPNSTDVDLDVLLREPVSLAAPILEKYNWEKSAKKILDNIKIVGK